MMAKAIGVRGAKKILTDCEFLLYLFIKVLFLHYSIEYLELLEVLQ